MNPSTVYDLIGIGIGPFNLGLAALCHPLPVKTVFFDTKASFDWHPGLLLPEARMQVPFYADLVTLVDPCSPFSYFAYLKAQGRFFRFAVHEQYYLTRKEYVAYCRWVTSHLNNLQFGCTVTRIHYSATPDCYTVEVVHPNGEEQILRTKGIVIGVGTAPHVPSCAPTTPSSSLFHASHYLSFKEAVLQRDSVLLVGSGQSAAEIFYDLLPHSDRFTGGLRWYTRSDRFYAMDVSKLSLEMTSPDYVDYFFSLPKAQKQKTLSAQQDLYKGINASLISQIWEALYWRSLDESKGSIQLATHCRLEDLRPEKDHWKASFYQWEQEKEFSVASETVILATGYQYTLPHFLNPIKEKLLWREDGTLDVQRNYNVTADARIFVQNGELHTHGFSAPDLGLGPYRNAIILNTILGYPHFTLEIGTPFQCFGTPG